MNLWSLLRVSDIKQKYDGNIEKQRNKINSFINGKHKIVIEFNIGVKRKDCLSFIRDEILDQYEKYDDTPTINIKPAIH